MGNRRIMALLTAFALLWPAAPAGATKPDADEAGRFWGRRVTGYLPVADGTRLFFSALLPARNGRFPVIVNYSGYDPGAIGGPAYLRGETIMSAQLDRALVRAGYAVVGVNMRGTGCSEGAAAEFLGPTFGSDGRDAIEFIATQPWSDGMIGMANYSFPGITQLATAIEQPPHLKAIAPGMVVADLRLDSWAPGGIPQTGFATSNAGESPMRGWFREDATIRSDTGCLARLSARRPPTTFEVQFTHPVRDDWHRSRRLSDRADRIQVPVLSVEAFQDEQTGPRGDYYQDRVRPGLLWLVQTNGHHGLYMAEQFWREHLIPFFDHFLRNKPNGFEQRPRVTVWQDTRWSAPPRDMHRALAARPGWSFTLPRYPVKVIERVFEFGPGGTLIPHGDTASAANDEYAYPMPGPAVNLSDAGGAWGAQEPNWRKGSLAYTSAPLAADLMIYGPASADLWMDTTAADADVQVTLTERLPNGEEVYLQRGWLRLSARALDESRSNAVRPVILDEPLAAKPAGRREPVLARVELNEVAYLFRAGSALRLWIDAPSPTGLNAFDIVSIPSINRVFRGGDMRSRLVLGTLDGVSVPSAAGKTPCTPAVLSQPCRHDPLAGR